MQALVLVGGEGTRLRPLTAAIPKPVVPLVDRPFIAYMVEWLGRHGVDEVVLACGFMPDALREALGEGAPGGPRLRYAVEPEPRGTAGAIKFAEEMLEERFLALNGDVLADLDLGALIRAHEEGGGPATIGLYPVEDASAYGLVDTGPHGEVLAFREKTGERAPREINAGAYVLDRSLLAEVPMDRSVSIEREVFPRLVGAGLRAARLDGYWMDIGTPERYLQASWDILEGRVETAVEATGPGIFLDPGAVIEEDASVGPRAVAAAGVRVGAGANVRDSVLLAGAVVGAGAEVRGSILSPGAEVADGAAVEGAIVGAGERLPA